jgi:hypothetical protein
MDIKLALLFLFVSAMITLSHLDDENVERIKQQLRRRQWREFRLWRTKVRFGLDRAAGAKDYLNSRYHISFARAIGRRLRALIIGA